MKQLYFKQILSAPIQRGDSTPNPGGPTVVWSTITSSPLVWNGFSWGSLTDPKLRTLEGLNTFGFVVRDPNSGNFVTRELAGTADQIQVFNSQGDSNPSISLTNTGVISGSYAKVTVDAQGRVRRGDTLTAADMPADYMRLFDENYVDAAPSNVTGSNSVSIGNGNNVPTNNSIVLGEQGFARHKNSLIYSNGRFASQGDAQTGRYILRTVTTNNFQKELYLDGPVGNTPLIIPDHSTWTFRATITAHQTDGDAETAGRAGWEIKGVVYKISGSNSIKFQGAPIIEVLGRSNPSWMINTNANNIDGSLSFVVQGESGKTIRWLAAIETVEITN